MINKEHIAAAYMTALIIVLVGGPIWIWGPMAIMVMLCLVLGAIGLVCLFMLCLTFTMGPQAHGGKIEGYEREMRKKREERDND